MILLRFVNLKERGIVNSWPQLKRLQQLHGFPLGRMLSPNTRAWSEDEIVAWFETRPVENTRPINGGLREFVQQRRERRKAALEANA